MKHCLFAIAISALMTAAAAQTELPPVGIGEVRIEHGDDPVFSQPGFDDRGWSRGRWYEVQERGVWWLRKRLELPEEYAETTLPVGLYVSAAASAEVYWDGRLVGRNGVVGASPREERPGRIDAVIPIPPEGLGEGEHLLAIRFSSHHAGRGVETPVDVLMLARFGSPRAGIQREYQPAVLAGGALALAAAMLLVLWLRDRRAAPGWLLLACCLALAQLVLEVSRAYVSYDYSWHQWRLLAIGVAAGLGGLCVLGHLIRRFHLPGLRYWLGGNAALQLGLHGAVGNYGLTTGTTILAWLASGLVLSVLAVRRRRRGAGLALAGLAVLLGAMWLDPGAFLDLTYFIGLATVLLIFIGDALLAQARIRRERDQARLRSARLELELLKQHLRPHFLLNTLTALSEWLETEPHMGARMIEALGREFRALDRIADQALIPMRDELALCRAHLEVMAYRQGRNGRLVVAGDTDFLVPPAVVHTLVENALTHGEADSAEFDLHLLIEHDAGRVRLVFTGPPGAAAREAGLEGIGLGYVRARLEEAWGAEASLDHGPTDRGWQTRVEFPRVASTPPAASAELGEPGYAR